MRRLIFLALASPAFASMVSAQTSVDIRTGPNGQLSGSATAGGSSTHVNTGSNNGRPVGDGPWNSRGAHSEAHCSGNGRTMTVTSPDGTSSSSVSTSSSEGTVSVGGGGSPGSRVRYGDCDGVTGRATSAYGASRGTYAATSASAAPGSSVRQTTRNTIRHHRKRHTRRH